MKLTLEEAKALRDFLENQCVSYYEVDLRESISIATVWLNEYIIAGEQDMSEPEIIEEVFPEEIIEQETDWLDRID